MDIYNIKSEVKEYLKGFEFEEDEDKIVEMIKTNVEDFLDVYSKEFEVDVYVVHHKKHSDLRVTIGFDVKMDFITRKKEKEVKYKIIRNMAKCFLCGDIIESKHRHDFVRCKCGAIFVDGGIDYLRRGGERENIIEMSESEIIE